MAVKVMVNGIEHEVSNAVAVALFRSPSGDGRVYPVTTKVNAKQKAWVIEQCGLRGVTQSALIAGLIDKEMQNE
jgi:hypothetical protein